MQKSDAQIRDEVQLELGWDSRFCATDVGVAVSDGAVTLTGTVATYAERVAAGEAAHRAIGVLDVANDIVVRPPNADQRSDTELAQWVRRALRAWPGVPDERVHSTVTDGWVTLEGVLDNASQRDDVERAIAPLRGVRGVNNQIGVVPLHLKGVQVWLHDGTATVVGRVRSFEERIEVLAVVQQAVGSRTVEDQLTLSQSE